MVLYVVWKDDLKDPLLLLGNPIFSTSGKKFAEVSVKVFYEVFCYVFTKTFHFSFCTLVKAVQA